MTNLHQPSEATLLHSKEEWNKYLRNSKIYSPMSPAELLQIKIRLLEIACNMAGNSYKDTEKKYNDLCQLIGLPDYNIKESQ